MTPDRTTIKRHLMSWGTGAPAVLATAPTQEDDACATVLVESSEHVADLRATGVIGAQTVVFAPDERAGDAAVYVGAAAEPGQELAFGDFYLQIQDYATSPYMSILGPTLVKLFSSEDLAALWDDADTARETGTFPEFATAPTVQLGDLPGLGLGVASDGPGLRLYVDAEGTMSTSTAGMPLGSLGATPQELAARWDALNEASDCPCAVCLAGTIPEDERVAGIAARPWLAGYLLALDALRDLHARDVADARVSGFGGRMDARIADRPAHEGSDFPLLLWTDAAAYVRAPRTRRTFELPLEVGRLAEALLVCGSIAEAGELADSAELERVASMFTEHGITLVPGEHS